MPLTRRSMLSAVVLAAPLATPLAMPAIRSRAAEARTVRIGYQRYGTLIILKHTGMLEAALAGSADRVSWSEFAAGPQMLQAMQAGAIDFGITGDAPPIFAQAASGSSSPNGVVYVGHEPAAPFGEAIIVPAKSPIRTVAQLKGHTVGLNRASNVHWLLLAALAKAGLGMSDIQPVFLVPGSARPAFDSGRLDAWAIWDHYLSAAEAATATRVVAQADGLVGNRQFFLAGRGFAGGAPPQVRRVLGQLAGCAAWSQPPHAEVSQVLADDTGLPLPVVRRAVDRLSFGVSPMTPDVVAEQQKIADAFFAQHLLPSRLTVQDAVWTPPA